MEVKMPGSHCSVILGVHAIGLLHINPFVHMKIICELGFGPDINPGFRSL